MQFKTINIDGINVFYREAGTEGMPKLVLLHGFPSSSHQYRNLMHRLKSQFHIIAPDYPGFGLSDMPGGEEYSYTFDRTSEVIEFVLERLGFTKCGFYLQDYGGPVGFRLLTRRPGWLEWLIIQNTNAYEAGFTATWDGLRGAYWERRDEAAEKALLPFLELDTIKTIYTHGHPKAELISPDNWNMDAHFLERLGAKQVQLDFFYDYRTNVPLYAKVQQWLRDLQPKTIIFWGQDDIFFTRQGGELYLRDLPHAEMHRLASGHFALEDCLEEIAVKMVTFL